MPKKKRKNDNYDVLSWSEESFTSCCFWNSLLFYFSMNHRLQLWCMFFWIFTFYLSGFTQWTSCCTITQLFTFPYWFTLQVVLTWYVSFFSYRFRFYYVSSSLSEYIVKQIHKSQNKTLSIHSGVISYTYVDQLILYRYILKKILYLND